MPGVKANTQNKGGKEEKVRERGRERGREREREGEREKETLTAP